MFPAPNIDRMLMTFGEHVRTPNPSECDPIPARDAMPPSDRWAGPRFGAPFSTTRRIGE